MQAAESALSKAQKKESAALASQLDTELKNLKKTQEVEQKSALKKFREQAKKQVINIF